MTERPPDVDTTAKTVLPARAPRAVPATTIVVLSGLLGGLLGALAVEGDGARLAVCVAALVVLTSRTIRRGVSGHTETTPLRALVAGVVVIAAAAVLAGSDVQAALRAGALSGVGWAGGVFASRRAIAALRRRRIGLASVVVVGTGETGVGLAHTLLRHPHLGLLPVGFVDDRPPLDSDLPLLGPTRDLPTILLRLGVQQVVLAYGSTAEPDLVPILRDLATLPRQVRVLALPRLFELAEPSDGDVWGYPLTEIGVQRAAGTPWHLKRAFDVVFAGTALLLLAPVMALVAAAIRIDSPGPVLFRQTRVGQWGRTFTILKFRSMRDDPTSAATWGAAEARITRVGRLLRPTHLDELPQLVNVLRGDMSVVGPRPERPEFVSEFQVAIPRYEDRHRVPVGITGWAQVNGLWGETAIDDRARFDNRYIERWSLALDARILLRTLATMTGGRADEADDA